MNKFSLNRFFLLILLVLSSGFIIALAYFNKSPQSLIKSFISTNHVEPELINKSDLYSYLEPIDHNEIVFDFLEELEKGNSQTFQRQAERQDITAEFKDYAKRVHDFGSLSNIVTTWDNKYLAFHKSKLYLFQILDKRFFLKSIEVPGIRKIKFAHIFSSGNILFCDYQNAYYSHDNLLTYHKSDVLDIDGNKYKADDYGNFFSLNIDNRQIIDGKEIRVWGNYTNYGSWQPGKSRSGQVLVWYTADEGKTIKTAYKFGYSEPKLLSRHVHAVNMCPWDNSFWVQTGDMTDECHWMQGEYDWSEDKWSWNVKATGDHMSFFKSTGFVFQNGYVIWSDDSSDPEKHGIWRIKYSNLLSDKINTSQFERVLKTDKEIAKLVGDDDKFLLASQYFKSSDNKYKIFASYDGGRNWQTISTTFQIINLHLPNSFGQILGNYFINQDTFEAIHYWDGAPSIFINSYLNDSNPSNKIRSE